MLRALAAYVYGRDLGAGVYDIHSPVVPTVEGMAAKLRAGVAAGLLGGDATRLWVNPDCGLKTRRYEEAIPALRNMVAAAALVRAELAGGAPAAAAPAAADARRAG
jgi:5-methyltetrahydropteroyltriglutamate--homocysteine methyltransferase